MAVSTVVLPVPASPAAAPGAGVWASAARLAVLSANAMRIFFMGDLLEGWDRLQWLNIRLNMPPSRLTPSSMNQRRWMKRSIGVSKVPSCIEPAL